MGSEGGYAEVGTNQERARALPAPDGVDGVDGVAGTSSPAASTRGVGDGDGAAALLSADLSATRAPVDEEVAGTRVTGGRDDDDGAGGDGEDDAGAGGGRVDDASAAWLTAERGGGSEAAGVSGGGGMKNCPDGDVGMRMLRTSGDEGMTNEMEAGRSLATEDTGGSDGNKGMGATDGIEGVVGPIWRAAVVVGAAEGGVSAKSSGEDGTTS